MTRKSDLNLLYFGFSEEIKPAPPDWKIYVKGETSFSVYCEPMHPIDGFWFQDFVDADQFRLALVNDPNLDPHTVFAHWKPAKTEVETTNIPNEAFHRALKQYCADKEISINPDYVLGRGVSATVYAIDDAEVLLLTYVKSKVAVARALGISHEIIAYDVKFKLSRYDSQFSPIYAIRMKRLLPLSYGNRDHEYQYENAESIVYTALKRAGHDWRSAWDIVRRSSEADEQLRLLAHLAYISPSTPGADMHGGNAMIDPDSGELIYTDILHYFGEQSTTPMIENIPTIDDLPETSDFPMMHTCFNCGESVETDAGNELHDQLISSGFWCVDCIIDNLAQINTGSNSGLWALNEDIHATGSKIFWHEDSRLTWDDLGETALRDHLIEVNDLLLDPKNVCKDVFGNFHDIRNRGISWDRCKDCNAVIPLNTNGEMHKANHHNLKMFRRFLDNRELIATDIRNNWTFGIDRKPNAGLLKACNIGH